MPSELRTYARQVNLLTLTKANARATVHRPGYLDYIGVKRFDAAGEVIGERRLLGLYTSTAYSTSPTLIPLLRSKVAAVMQRAGYLPRSHAAKALATILEQYPRDELIQTSIDDLYATAVGILRLGERQRTRLFVRRDTFGRFYSCLLFVPRENYNTDVRQRMQAALSDALHGASSEFTVHLSDSPLARILIVIRTRPGAAPDYDVRELEQRLVRLARRWEDELAQALVEAVGEERGNTLFAQYAGGFAAGYRDEHAPRMAVHDIEQLDTLDAPDAVAMNLYVPLEAPPGRLRFKLIRAGELAPLSQSLPMLEHMGVRVLEERPFEVRRADGQELWIDDFGLAVPDGTALVDNLDIERLRGPFQETFLRTWRGDNDDDDFNRLVLLAGLDWRSVGVLRAYARYMKQAAFTFSQRYIEQALATHPAIAAELMALFHARFDPARDDEQDGGRSAREADIAARITAALDSVANLDEDRILRHYLAMIQATLRTNFYQCDAAGQPKPSLSFKFDPAKVPLLPEPKPMFEIFVHSPRVEGVHLRGGKVARGGLRWSDRMEDYRTEVLGLVKAQQVKNAVIVPVGSKGGFVLKQPPPAGDREALMKEGIACYQTYLRGLLDLTDNLVAGQVVPPPDVVRHDGDDPYLVVAADKGTATFSDIANRTAAEYGFWLGDAFASGGSAGYDHKGMAITARGAWESVKRHFRSLDRDTQTQDFTVVGIGDMSGDVFGNGMLLSRHIRLLAAVDHRHVFIDPSPDTEASFAERERLFKLPRSSWADYDTTLISRGGGVFARSAKSVALSPQARAALGIEAENLAPTELIHAILQAPVDLLYNGGIGTYVKASSETHADVGDRANDAIRVDGAELRCKVVAEGGNLGVTQRGRIEYALRGGLINTDAIDNSGGVDCSDHEVNIKILLNQVVTEGELTGKQRDRLLADMTDEVAQLVLRDNRAQNQILALERARGAAQLDEQARYMRHLTSAGRLNRRLEFLPSDDVIAERAIAHVGLTTPELAVLLAYGKMELYDAVLASDIPEDPYIATSLERYFPQPLRERFPQQIRRHPLRREIIATHVVNSMVNRIGPTFCFRLQEETGAAPAEIVRAYLGTREIFGLVSLWSATEALDNTVQVDIQQAILQATTRLAVRGTVWLLQRRASLSDLDATIRHFAPGVSEVGNGLTRWLAAHERAPIDTEVERLTAQGIPKSLAQRVAQLDAQFSALNIVEVGAETARSVDTVAGVYFGLGGRLELGWLSQQIGALAADSRWAGLARVALRDDLTSVAHGLAKSVLRLSPQEQDTDTLIAAWEAQREAQLGRCRQLLAELRPSAALDLAMVSVTLRQLRALI
jgi:glutamate dehydrogenase